MSEQDASPSSSLPPEWDENPALQGDAPVRRETSGRRGSSAPPALRAAVATDAPSMQ